MRIVFANQKGGVGKSTLCMLFANYLANMEKEVCIVDVDLQRSIWSQRKSDEETYNGMEAPYSIITQDVKTPAALEKFMQDAKKLEDTAILFDVPGNVTEDGLIPLFVNADVIVCPYKYEEKIINSTWTFVKVLNQLKVVYKEKGMNPLILFVPNSIDARIGTNDELSLWKDIDLAWNKLGCVTPRIPYRAKLQRVNTYSIFTEQIDLVKDCFDFLIKKIFIDKNNNF